MIARVYSPYLRSSAMRKIIRRKIRTVCKSTIRLIFTTITVSFFQFFGMWFRSISHSDILAERRYFIEFHFEKIARTNESVQTILKTDCCSIDLLERTICVRTLGTSWNFLLHFVYDKIYTRFHKTSNDTWQGCTLYFIKHGMWW